MLTNLKIGITGLPSVGKTSTLLKVVNSLEDKRRIVGGMVTEEIQEKGQRVGFKVTNWLTKEEAVLAHVSISSDIRVAKYGVDLAALEKIGVIAIEQAVKEAEVIIIDEVGKMEMESPKFVKAVEAALDCDKPLLMTLHKKSRNPLLQDIRRRDDIRILEVTPINKNLLPYKIQRLLEGEVL